LAGPHVKQQILRYRGLEFSIKFSLFYWFMFDIYISAAMIGSISPSASPAAASHSYLFRISFSLVLTGF